jgi:hypothetical protein
MAAQQRKETVLLEMTRDEQREATEWLQGYLRLVTRIHREHRERVRPSYPQPPVDELRGTGTVRTVRKPDRPAK